MHITKCLTVFFFSINLLFRLNLKRNDFVVIFFLSLVSVYLFAIRSTRERTKEKIKSYYLDSHGEEAQKKPADLKKCPYARFFQSMG